tara:strand:+ start:728 stop:1000 length:273 start_codon:yes stop_codon:yes gene_type:complete
MEAHGIPTALVITEPFAPIVAGFAPTVGMEEYTGSIKVPHRVAQMDDDDLRTYPGPEHTVYMKDEELEQFAKDMKWDKGLEIAEKRKSGS